jgi:hypothetical protein
MMPGLAPPDVERADIVIVGCLPEYLGQSLLRGGCRDDMQVVSHQTIAEYIQPLLLAVFL